MRHQVSELAAVFQTFSLVLPDPFGLYGWCFAGIPCSVTEPCGRDAVWSLFREIFSPTSANRHPDILALIARGGGVAFQNSSATQAAAPGRAAEGVERLVSLDGFVFR